MEICLQQSSYVLHSFSARKIVENNECRTSNHRAQHEAKREHLKINGKVFPTLFPLSQDYYFQYKTECIQKKEGMPHWIDIHLLLGVIQLRIMQFLSCVELDNAHPSAALAS